MPSSEPVDAYCPTHDLFGCWYCHGSQPGSEIPNRPGPLNCGALLTPEFAESVRNWTPGKREAYFAHLAPDDPVRRQIGAFDFPDIPDEHEAGYDRRA